MDRILIVEDNKTLAKLISKKIKSELDYEVDVAYSLLEAKLFLKKYTYFITLLDLNLPDAPNGEVVDYVLEKKNRVIVLSGNIDKEFRKKILKKNIIDYVNKSGVNDINYIIQTLKRLEKNQQHKVLVVDDSLVFRNQLKGMLENLFYQVVTVAHGEEALGMLSVHPDISLVLTDYNMPVMDGLELTREIRKTTNKNNLSIIAISSNSDDEINAMFLKHGANDYITKPFSKEEFSCRIQNAIESLENYNLITNHASRDSLTGLYNRRYFFENMQNYFTQALEDEENFALAMVSIDNFIDIDKTHGKGSCDKALVTLAEVLNSSTDYKDIVAKFDGENFCLICKDINSHNATEIFNRIKSQAERSYTVLENNQEIRFTISMGICLSHEDTLDETVSQADMLLYNAKQAGGNQILFN